MASRTSRSEAAVSRDRSNPPTSPKQKAGENKRLGFPRCPLPAIIRTTTYCRCAETCRLHTSHIWRWSSQILRGIARWSTGLCGISKPLRVHDCIGFTTVIAVRPKQRPFPRALSFLCVYLQNLTGCEMFRAQNISLEAVEKARPGVWLSVEKRPDPIGNRGRRPADKQRLAPGSPPGR